MAKSVIVGIDAGTTMIKAGLVDDSGNLIDVESINNEVLSPFEDAFEMDMNQVWEKVCIVTNRLLNRNSDLEKSIVGLGITGQGDGLWPVDEKGEPVRNAILWNDTRTKRMKLENEEKIHELGIREKATPVFPGAASVLLKWLVMEEPASAQCISSILHCKDWLNFKFTDEVITDYTDASTALLNVFEKQYSDGLFNAMGISEYRGKFPLPVSSTQVIGKVTDRAGCESGIRPGIPVIAGALDGAAVAFGIGAREVGEACTIVGTTLNNVIILDESRVNHRDTNGSNLCYILPDKYLRVMANQSGTSSLDWVLKLLGRDLTFELIEKAIADIPIGSDGIIFHPYLYGERAPFKNPWACAGFYGLTARHHEHHMIRAAYEGLAYSLYDCYQAFPSVYEEIFLSGGGSKSDFLCQMFSDALGKVVKRPDRWELGIVGVAEAVSVGLGLSDSSRAHVTTPCKVFEPNMKRHEDYLRHFELFLELRKSMTGYWNKRYDGISPSL